MSTVIERFKEEYADLIAKGLEVDGLADLMGVTVIAGARPLVFDTRKIPSEYEGYLLRIDISEPLPEEFVIDESQPFYYEREYIWAPERFEKFVDRCASEIRTQLGEPNMTRSEMLDTLLHGNFEEHKRSILEAVAKGELPAYKEKPMRIVKVTYTVEEGFTPINIANIREVMNALREINDPGINYHVCLSPDNKTFIHTAFFSSEDKQQILFDLQEFKSFLEQLKASKPEVPVQQEVLSLVGSSKDLFS